MGRDELAALPAVADPCLPTIRINRSMACENGKTMIYEWRRGWDELASLADPCLSAIFKRTEMFYKEQICSS